jgi:hypothetical protein
VDVDVMADKSKKKKHKHHKHGHHKSKKHHTVEKVVKKGHKKHKHKHKAKHAKVAKVEKLVPEEVVVKEASPVKVATNGNGVVLPPSMVPVVISEDEESDVVISRPPSDSDDVDVGIIEDDMNLEELMRQKVRWCGQNY